MRNTTLYMPAILCEPAVRRTGSSTVRKELVSWGAGPRAGQYLILGARAHALLQGRFHVTTDDIRAVAKPVLRHRIMTTFAAASQGVTPDVVIDRLLKFVPVELQETRQKSRPGRQLTPRPRQREGSAKPGEGHEKLHQTKPGFIPCLKATV